MSNTSGLTAYEVGYNIGKNEATTHYQPLLDAKDAEIQEANMQHIADFGQWQMLQQQNTTLKALLEQAREGLERINEGDYRYLEGSEIYGDIAKVLTAINAAIGEK